MHYRTYQSLRVFVHVGQYLNLTEAALSMSMTKGAVSYQIKQLESQLGFAVFSRQHGGIVFTRKGQQLYFAMSSLFEQIEDQIKLLSDPEPGHLTIGMTTYFASRWLTPRLMHFTSAHPDIRLRIQPTIGAVNLDKEQIDIAIQWGDGSWPDLVVEPLFLCPAFPTCSEKIYKILKQEGLVAALQSAPLLHDFDNSTSWDRWLSRAGLDLPAGSDALVIPDPNVRVEAVKNAQGIALNDALVSSDIEKGRLFALSETRLEEFGYFLTYPEASPKTAVFDLFRRWILDAATPGDTQ